MEQAQRKRPLHPGHLVVVQLHRVLQPAAILVVLGIRSEDAGQQNVGMRAPGMLGVRLQYGGEASDIVDERIDSGRFQEPKDG